MTRFFPIIIAAAAIIALQACQTSDSIKADDPVSAPAETPVSSDPVGPADDERPPPTTDDPTTDDPTTDDTPLEGDGYDPLANCTVTYQIDNYPYGTFDEISVEIYDDAARLLSVETDNGADGVFDDRTEYRYLSSGDLSERDEFVDGVHIRKDRYTYTDGRLVLQETLDPESVLTWTAYAYDEAGYLALKEIDVTGDGRVDLTWSWTNDTEGRVLSGDMVGSDHYTECYKDWAIVNTWEGDLLVEIVRDWFDSYTDTFTSTDAERFFYDEDAHLVSQKYFRDDADTPSSEKTWRWEGDNMVEYLRDSGYTGEPDYQELYGYDEDGLVVSLIEELFGLWYTETLTVRDDLGRPLNETVNSRVDWTASYNCP